MGAASSVAAGLWRPVNVARPSPFSDDGPLTIDRHSAREAAERELVKPEYQEHQPGLLRRALEWLTEQADRLISAAGSMTFGGWLGLLTIALLVGLLLVALRLRLGALLRRSNPSEPVLFPSGPTSASQHREAAERFAAEERWSEAVQERMRAVVRSLEERTLLPTRPDRTAGEAAADAGAALPALAPQLRAAATSFDEVTYGRRTADAVTYNRVKALDAALADSRPSAARSRATGAT